MTRTHQGHPERSSAEWNALMEALRAIAENPAESHSRRSRAQEILNSIVAKGKELRVESRSPEQKREYTDDSWLEDLI